MAILVFAGPASADDTLCRTEGPVFAAQGALNALASKLSGHKPIQILAIGSSSTEGIGASAPQLSYPAQLENDLTGLWNEKVTVINAGRGGETAVQTIDRLQAALTTSKFDLVIWQVGTNDAVNGVDEGRFREILERGISAAKTAGVDMILLDQQYFPTIKDPARYETFVKTVSTVGSERKVSVFSRYALMKQWNDHSASDLRGMLSADGFHMGDRGYDCLASLIAQELQTMAADSIAGAEPLSKTVASARRR
ncbi:SGNH/GDSL hydrolase family protein [Microvirga alba]|uniref:SGNH/GDSL hydrolase family protein n=1 Tax=Microvirga alba TaxID=2791025 RepID=A0A931FS22_9HYPH|nr:SGNH/GDSL hydrolase family protein [Microvirga alba]MBF9233301.1 SGNH/GDSL hydrolase family protein [Microvirga alba]